MGVLINEYDSQVYRKLFEFVQKEGVEVLKQFIVDYEMTLNQDHLTRALLDGKHNTLSFVNKHRAMSKFLKELKLDDKPCFLKDWNFPKYAASLLDDDISCCIERAKYLEDLRFERVRLLDRIPGILTYESLVFYDKDGNVTDVSKQYSNGSFFYREVPDCSRSGRYDVYKVNISFSNCNGMYVLSTENRSNGLQHRTANLSDFCFDMENLPDEEEITSYCEPQSLRESKVFVKKR